MTYTVRLIERALITDGRRLLLACLLRHTRVSDPEEAVCGMAEAYLRFARRPALYLFVMDYQVAKVNRVVEPGKQLWQLVLDRVGAKSGPKGGWERGLEALVLGFRGHARSR